jgi:hypothetical protein
VGPGVRSVVGFSSADRIVFSKEALMHLHILSPTMRGKGMGAGSLQRCADLLLHHHKAPGQRRVGVPVVCMPRAPVHEGL